MAERSKLAESCSLATKNIFGSLTKDIFGPTRFGRLVTYHEGLQSLKSHDLLMKRSCKRSQNKVII